MPNELAGTPLPLRIVLGGCVVARPAFFTVTDVFAAATAPCIVKRVIASDIAMALLRLFMGKFHFSFWE